MYNEYENIDRSEQLCGNCKHWDLKRSLRFDGRELAPCAMNAVEMDAGYGGVALLGEDCHCLNHSGEFEPAEEFLEELRERALPEYVRNGVVAGVDFPATLGAFRSVSGW